MANNVVHNTVGTSLTQSEFEADALHKYLEYSTCPNPTTAQTFTVADMGKFYFAGGGDATTSYLPVASTCTPGMTITVCAQNISTTISRQGSDTLYHYGTGGAAAASTSELLTAYSIYKFLVYAAGIWVWWIES